MNEFKLNYYKNVHNIDVRDFTKPNGDRVIQIRQNEKDDNEYFTEKELLDILDKLFAEEEVSYHKSVIPFYHIAHSVVSDYWLRQQQNQYRLKSKAIAKELNISKTRVNNHHNGLEGMSNEIKAMYYYYYLSKM